MSACPCRLNFRPASRRPSPTHAGHPQARGEHPPSDILPRVFADMSGHANRTQHEPVMSIPMSAMVHHCSTRRCASLVAAQVQVSPAREDRTAVEHMQMRYRSAIIPGLLVKSLPGSPNQSRHGGRHCSVHPLHTRPTAGPGFSTVRPTLSQSSHRTAARRHYGTSRLIRSRLCPTNIKQDGGRQLLATIIPLRHGQRSPCPNRRRTHAGSGCNGDCIATVAAISSTSSRQP